MESWQYLLLAGVGVAAGFLNVMAGGGSLLTLPVMIFAGFSPALANGTNRVALLAQNLTAVGEFRRQGFSDFKLSLSLALFTLPGTVLGSLAAVRIDPLWFKRLLAVVMVGVLIQMLRPRRSRTDDPESTRVRSGWAHVTMIGVGFYGGFIQAGVGFILMMVLHGLLRLDLVRVNMHKVFIVGLYMIPSLAVFALSGQVSWLAGGLLAVGNALGAWLAANLQIKKGEKAVKVVFAIAVLAMATKLALS